MLLANRTFNLFDELFRDPFFNHSFDSSNTHLMKTDVQEKDGYYQVDLELPGYGKEEVQAELKNGYLIITAKHTENKDEKDESGKYLFRERYTGTCKRNFYVGEQIKQEDIRAEFQNGILRILVPKEEPKVAEEQQPKLIDIK